jgi:hypothetical protein
LPETQHLCNREFKAFDKPQPLGHSKAKHKRYKRIHSLKTKLISYAATLALTLSGYTGLTLSAAPAVHAACPVIDTSLGTDTVTYTIPTAGTYRVWARIQSDTATNNSFNLQIDSACAVAVGGANITPNTWTWVDYTGGVTTNKLNATLTAASHTFVLTGIDPGVMVDRVIFATDSACVPTGTGDNCAVPPTVATPTPTPTPTLTATPTPTPAAGTPGDTNGDGHVDITDLSVLLGHWGTNFTKADFDHNGTINITDLSVLLGHWTG